MLNFLLGWGRISRLEQVLKHENHESSKSHEFDFCSGSSGIFSHLFINFAVSCFHFRNFLTTVWYIFIKFRVQSSEFRVQSSECKKPKL